MNQAADEIDGGKRFAFGANWIRFLEAVSDERIRQAEDSLRDMLEVDNLEGVRFCDAGSGSGLFSLAARRLGASVHSFDFDPQSVACTQELKRRFRTEDDGWAIEQGSILDRGYLSELGQFDIVYSWGVLHHTGAMYQSMENVATLVRADGRLFVALYNDQGYISQRWARVKRTYNERPVMRPFLLAFGLVRGWGRNTLLDLYHLRPFDSWRKYSKERGMSPWWDVVDWIGGWPYEVATPEAVFRFYRDRGFALQNLVTRQGLGCNEFVFVKT